MNKKVVVAISGASGSIYAHLLLNSLQKFSSTELEVGVVMSLNAKDVWKYELGNEDWKNYSFNFFEKNDFMAPFASGSAHYETMIVCPCSMGVMGRIASGVSDDLTTRAADVILKERRRLILVTRETPLNLIHINNMLTITQAGGIICPASPSFYTKPQTADEIALTVVNRVLDLAGLGNNAPGWSES